MKRQLFLILFFALTFQLQAQLVKKVWVYGGKANQFEGRTYVDKIGNIFHTLTFDSTFTIDSSGFPVLIKHNLNGIYNKFPTVAIIKFNASGIYQFHLIIKGWFVYEPFLNFLNNNEIILTYNFYQKDTIDLYHSNGTLYKRITPQYRRKPTDTWYQNAHLICKLSQTGVFLWETLFTRTELNDNNTTSGASYLNHPTNINKNNEITSFFPYQVNGNFDSIIITNKYGIRDTNIVFTPNLFIKLSQDGQFISTIEPIKNKLKYKCHNGHYYLDQQIQTKTGKYQLLTLYTYYQDTFNRLTPIEPGKNILLIKYDEIDSIIWVKKVVHEYPVLSNHSPILCYDEHREEIIVSNFYQAFVGWRKLLINPNFLSYYDGSHMCRLNLDGDIVWEDFYRDINFYGLSYNNTTKNIFAYGLSNGTENNIQKFLLNNPLRIYQPFICYFDSSNNVNSAQPIVSNLSTLISPKNNVNTSISIGKLSAYSEDNQGGNYLSCRFYDSLSIPCQTYRAIVDTNSFGTPTCDGFVLYSKPIIPLYTPTCLGKLSPSGRYYWTNTGYYFDTLTNLQGCDSLLYFYVHVLKSNSVLDSTVCTNMRSYSGKYLWDSSGTYFDTIPNTHNCDSLVTVHLKVLPKFFHLDTIVKIYFNAPSGKFVWDSSGIYIDSLVNTYGCDSILKINLKVLQSYGHIDTTVCKEYLSPSGKYTFRINGLYQDTIPNAIGSDSILSINIHILQNFSTIDTVYCSSILSLSLKHIYSNSGLYTDTLTNSMNCDSIVSIQFTRTPTRDSIFVSECAPYKGKSGKLNLDKSGIYLDSLFTQKGCDSILNIHYTNLSSHTNILINVCDSLISPSKKYTYKESGNYMDTIQNKHNCDSIINLQLNIEPIKTFITKSNNITCDSPFAQMDVKGGSSYFWQPNTNLSNLTISNPIANPDKSTWYYVLVQTEIGCKAKDSIEILVQKDLQENKLTNVFSPNNDGINDCFAISSIAEFKEVEILIYNRWGNLVYSSIQINSCWDGTNKNGEHAATGTYYYLLAGTSICNELLNLRGTITLLR
ncbi:MAG: gliding motility-associated C-terminal domain-containing protein [bacterium]|nr:gliding motility-associated C-terminal domain-containing protein [bacterium]